jgi:hypothetical protein
MGGHEFNSGSFMHSVDVRITDVDTKSRIGLKTRTKCYQLTN